MNKEISQRTRELAIEALDLGASNPNENPYTFVANRLKALAVVNLMNRAWHAVPGCDAYSLAAAAGLLRDGWSPGEHVITIGPGEL